MEEASLERQEKKQKSEKNEASFDVFRVFFFLFIPSLLDLERDLEGGRKKKKRPLQKNQ